MAKIAMVVPFSDSLSFEMFPSYVLCFLSCFAKVNSISVSKRK